jgi:hypothetical protein
MTEDPSSSRTCPSSEQPPANNAAPPDASSENLPEDTDEVEDILHL